MTIKKLISSRYIAVIPAKLVPEQAGSGYPGIETAFYEFTNFR
jgi:hypothetical protein